MSSVMDKNAFDDIVIKNIKVEADDSTVAVVPSSGNAESRPQEELEVNPTSSDAIQPPLAQASSSSVGVASVNMEKDKMEQPQETLMDSEEGKHSDEKRITLKVKLPSSDNNKVTVKRSLSSFTVSDDKVEEPKVKKKRKVKKFKIPPNGKILAGVYRINGMKVRLKKCYLKLKRLVLTPLNPLEKSIVKGIPPPSLEPVEELASSREPRPSTFTSSSKRKRLLEEMMLLSCTMDGLGDVDDFSSGDDEDCDPSYEPGMEAEFCPKKRRKQMEAVQKLEERSKSLNPLYPSTSQDHNSQLNVLPNVNGLTSEPWLLNKSRIDKRPAPPQKIVPMYGPNIRPGIPILPKTGSHVLPEMKTSSGVQGSQKTNVDNKMFTALRDSVNNLEEQNPILVAILAGEEGGPSTQTKNTTSQQNTTMPKPIIYNRGVPASRPVKLLGPKSHRPAMQAAMVGNSVMYRPRPALDGRTNPTMNSTTISSVVQNHLRQIVPKMQFANYENSRVPVISYMSQPSPVAPVQVNPNVKQRRCVPNILQSAKKPPPPQPLKYTVGAPREVIFQANFIPFNPAPAPSPFSNLKIQDVRSGNLKIQDVRSIKPAMRVVSEIIEEARMKAAISNMIRMQNPPPPAPPKSKLRPIQPKPTPGTEREESAKRVSQFLQQLNNTTGVRPKENGTGTPVQPKRQVSILIERPDNSKKCLKDNSGKKCVTENSSKKSVAENSDKCTATKTPDLTRTTQCTTLPFKPDGGKTCSTEKGDLTVADRTILQMKQVFNKIIVGRELCYKNESVSKANQTNLTRKATNSSSIEVIKLTNKTDATEKTSLALTSATQKSKSLSSLLGKELRPGSNTRTEEHSDSPEIILISLPSEDTEDNGMIVVNEVEVGENNELSQSSSDADDASNSSSLLLKVLLDGGTSVGASTSSTINDLTSSSPFNMPTDSAVKDEIKIDRIADDLAQFMSSFRNDKLKADFLSILCSSNKDDESELSENGAVNPNSGYLTLLDTESFLGTVCNSVEALRQLDGFTLSQIITLLQYDVLSSSPANWIPCYDIDSDVQIIDVKCGQSNNEPENIDISELPNVLSHDQLSLLTSLRDSGPSPKEFVEMETEVLCDIQEVTATVKSESIGVPVIQRSGKVNISSEPVEEMDTRPIPQPVQELITIPEPVQELNTALKSIQQLDNAIGAVRETDIAVEPLQVLNTAIKSIKETPENAQKSMKSLVQDLDFVAEPVKEFTAVQSVEELKNASETVGEIDIVMDPMQELNSTLRIVQVQGNATEDMQEMDIASKSVPVLNTATTSQKELDKASEAVREMDPLHELNNVLKSVQELNDAIVTEREMEVTLDPVQELTITVKRVQDLDNATEAVQEMNVTLDPLQKLNSALRSMQGLANVTEAVQEIGIARNSVQELDSTTKTTKDSLTAKDSICTQEKSMSPCPATLSVDDSNSTGLPVGDVILPMCLEKVNDDSSVDAEDNSSQSSEAKTPEADPVFENTDLFDNVSVEDVDPDRTSQLVLSDSDSCDESQEPDVLDEILNEEGVENFQEQTCSPPDLEERRTLNTKLDDKFPESEDIVSKCQGEENGAVSPHFKERRTLNMKMDDKSEESADVSESEEMSEEENFQEKACSSGIEERMILNMKRDGKYLELEHGSGDEVSEEEMENGEESECSPSGLKESKILNMEQDNNHQESADVSEKEMSEEEIENIQDRVCSPSDLEGRRTFNMNLDDKSLEVADVSGEEMSEDEIENIQVSACSDLEERRTFNKKLGDKSLELELANGSGEEVSADEIENIQERASSFSGLKERRTLNVEFDEKSLEPLDGSGEEVSEEEIENIQVRASIIKLHDKSQELELVDGTGAEVSEEEIETIQERACSPSGLEERIILNTKLCNNSLAGGSGSDPEVNEEEFKEDSPSGLEERRVLNTKLNDKSLELELAANSSEGEVSEVDIENLPEREFPSSDLEQSKTLKLDDVTDDSSLTASSFSEEAENQDCAFSSPTESETLNMEMDNQSRQSPDVSEEALSEDEFEHFQEHAYSPSGESKTLNVELDDKYLVSPDVSDESSEVKNFKECAYSPSRENRTQNTELVDKSPEPVHVSEEALSEGVKNFKDHAYSPSGPEEIRTLNVELDDCLHSLNIKKEIEEFPSTGAAWEASNERTADSSVCASGRDNELLAEIKGDDSSTDVPKPKKRTSVRLGPQASKQKTSQNSIKCFHCNTICDSSHLLYGHIKNKHFPKTAPWVCCMCGVSNFKILQSLQKHYRICHLNKLLPVPRVVFQCKYCQKKFLTNPGLRAHEKIHVEKMPYECPTCKQKLPSSNQLSKHNQKFHSQKPEHVCPTCGKSYKYMRHLVNHKCIHQSEKPHRCTVCQKSFNYKKNLHRHYLTHDAMRYMCPVCEATFPKKLDMKSHMRTEHKKKKKKMTHRCQQCSKTFEKKSDLKKHSQIHKARNKLKKTKDKKRATGKKKTKSSKKSKK